MFKLNSTDELLDINIQYDETISNIYLNLSGTTCHTIRLIGDIDGGDTKEDLLLEISNTFKNHKISESMMKAYIASIKASETALKSLKQEYLIP